MERGERKEQAVSMMVGQYDEYDDFFFVSLSLGNVYRLSLISIGRGSQLRLGGL